MNTHRQQTIKENKNIYWSRFEGSLLLENAHLQFLLPSVQKLGEPLVPDLVEVTSERFAGAVNGPDEQVLQTALHKAGRVQRGLHLQPLPVQLGDTGATPLGTEEFSTGKSGAREATYSAKKSFQARHRPFLPLFAKGRG